MKLVCQALRCLIRIASLVDFLLQPAIPFVGFWHVLPSQPCGKIGNRQATCSQSACSAINPRPMSVVERGDKPSRHRGSTLTVTATSLSTTALILVDRAESALAFVGGRRVGVSVLEQFLAFQLHKAAQNARTLTTSTAGNEICDSAQIKMTVIRALGAREPYLLYG
jgi:hypothetical protein